MMLSNPLIIAAMLFALLGLIFLIMTIAALRKRKLFGSAFQFVVALLMISLSALFGTISIAIQGYHALIMEELAATVKVEPAGEQKFIARFSLPDGSEKVFSLAGDQLYIDAHILKWKPLANIFGQHTSYELDRVAGRYAILNDETTKVHTVYSLSKEQTPGYVRSPAQVRVPESPAGCRIRVCYVHQLEQPGRIQGNGFDHRTADQKDRKRGRTVTGMVECSYKKRGLLFLQYIMVGSSL